MYMSCVAGRPRWTQSSSYCWWNSEVNIAINHSQKIKPIAINLYFALGRKMTLFL